jgi:hypothetical protein
MQRRHFLIAGSSATLFAACGGDDNDTPRNRFAQTNLSGSRRAVGLTSSSALSARRTTLRCAPCSRMR